VVRAGAAWGGRLALMGPRDPKDVAKDVLHDLMEEASELRRTKAEADHWLRDPEYGVLLQRLEDAHVAIKEALIEAERRVKTNEGWQR
jgi:hypothetical protein